MTVIIKIIIIDSDQLAIQVFIFKELNAEI